MEVTSSGNTSALSGQCRHIVPEIDQQGDPVPIGFCFRSFLSVIFDVVASIYYIVVWRAFVHSKGGDHVSCLVLRGSNGREWGMGGKMSWSGSSRAIPPCSRLKNLDDPVDKAQTNYYASILLSERKWLFAVRPVETNKRCCILRSAEIKIQHSLIDHHRLEMIGDPCSMINVLSVI